MNIWTSIAIAAGLALAAIWFGCAKTPNNPSQTGPLPDKPEGLTAQAVDSTTVRLTWTDMSNNEDGFEVQQSLDSDTSFATFASTEPGIIGVIRRDISADTVYYFRVRAFNLAGNSPWTSTVRWVTGSPQVALFKTIDIDITAPPLCLDWSPDSKYLITGWGDYVIRLIRIDGGYVVRRLEGHQRLVKAIDFHLDGVRVASGSNDDTVKVWDSTNGAVLKRIPGFNDKEYSIAFSPVAPRLAIGHDQGITVWDIDEFEVVAELPDTQRINHLAYNHAGTEIAALAGSEGGYDTLIFWDIEGGTLRSYRIAEGLRVQYSPDDRRLVINRDGAVVYELGAGLDLVGYTEGHDVATNDVTLSPDGRYIATVGYDRKVNIWSAFDFSLLQTLEGHTYVVYCAAFSPDGRWLATGSGDLTIRIWGPFY